MREERGMRREERGVRSEICPIKYESRATNPLSLDGFVGVGLASLGARASRPQSRANARRTLILAFSHKGRRDPLASIHT